MKHLLILVLLVQLISCNYSKTISRDKELTQEEVVSTYFEDVKNVLVEQGGNFWETPLYGPAIIVNTDTRQFFANENSTSRSFTEINGIFTDTLPVNINIANTVFDWDGKRWSMLMLPLPENKNERNNLIVHEFFHRIQPKVGLGDIKEMDNSHLDSRQGRTLLRLELEALQDALGATNKQKQLDHLKSAFSFRLARYASDQIRISENSLELNEGLAEYTGVMLSGRNKNEIKNHLISAIDSFFIKPSYVRSFAYQTTPSYGFLLSFHKGNWHREITTTSNLTDFFMEAFEISPPINLGDYVQEVANSYNFKEIEQQESYREKRLIAKLDSLKLKFINSKTLRLDFQNMNVSFDPGNLISLSPYGTIYPKLRITDDWGILEVNHGALMSNDWSNVRVSVPFKIKDSLIVGPGWSLILSKGWQIEENDQGYVVKN